MRGPVADAEKSPQAGKTREEGKPLNPVGSLDEVPFATLALSTRSEQFGAQHRYEELLVLPVGEPQRRPTEPQMWLQLRT